jgi:hypothetical protein
MFFSYSNLLYKLIDYQYHLLKKPIVEFSVVLFNQRLNFRALNHEEFDMKKLFLAIALTLLSTSAFADSYVNGYTRKDGTQVQGHYRSSPNNTVTDNYSYKGNSNPYTGSTGNNKYQHDTTSPYYSGPNSQGRVGHGGAYR